MSIRSMTAYGYGEHHAGPTRYVCEIRTLNSRFLEVSVRMPRHLMALETQATKIIKSRLSRGKVDLFFDIWTEKTSEDLPQIDEMVAKHYMAISQRFGELSGGRCEGLSSYELMRFDGVISEVRQSSKGEVTAAHQPGIETALGLAIDDVIRVRSKEGGTLSEALLKLTEQLTANLERLRGKTGEVQRAMYDNYLKRLKNLISHLESEGVKAASELPEERLLVEIAILTDKSDVDEEMTRLTTHIEEFGRCLKSQEPIGRKLDFLCQEMHREVNTLSNKFIQSSVHGDALEMKQVVERIRQQVQNIE